MRRSRRQLALGGAALVVLVLGAWMLWPGAPPPASVRPAAQARPAAAAPAVPGEVAPVRLDALTAAREGPGTVARNPFRFQPKVAPPAPRPVFTAPVPTGPVVAPPPPGPPPLPPIPLKFTGLVERANGVKWA